MWQIAYLYSEPQVNYMPCQTAVKKCTFFPLTTIKSVTCRNIICCGPSQKAFNLTICLPIGVSVTQPQSVVVYYGRASSGS